MASIDSGVDTGNDSNDSFAQDKNSYLQNESQTSSISSQTHPSEEPVPLGLNMQFCRRSTPRYLRRELKFRRYLDTHRHFVSDDFEFREGFSSAYKNFKLMNKYKPRKTRFANDAWLNGSMITKCKGDEVRLMMAACVSNIDEVRRLLEKGVNPNCADSNCRTPLHISACNGDSEIVKLLLDRGANPNLKDMIGNTPLHLAVCTNHIDVVTLLLKAGTDASCYNIIGRSPLQIAQSKLKIIQRSKDHAFRHQVTSQVIEMLLAFIKKKTEMTKNTVDEELLNAFQSRLQVSESQEQVENELQNLLDNLSSLSLSTKTSTITSITELDAPASI